MNDIERSPFAIISARRRSNGLNRRNRPGNDSLSPRLEEHASTRVRFRMMMMAISLPKRFRWQRRDAGTKQIGEKCTRRKRTNESSALEVGVASIEITIPRKSTCVLIFFYNNHPSLDSAYYEYSFVELFVLIDRSIDCTLLSIGGRFNFTFSLIKVEPSCSVFLFPNKSEKLVVERCVD